MRIAYYPGCTGRSTALEYHESVEETAKLLGVHLEEIPDWNCCGASSGHAVDYELALALAGRNLALAEGMSLDMVTTCPSCLHRHKLAQMELKKAPHLRNKVENHIGMPVRLSQKVKHILEVLYCDVGINGLQKKVKKPLKGLKAVIYYGCYLVRPPEVMSFDDPEDPRAMDQIMNAIGVELIEWSSKADCCGAGLAITHPETIDRLRQKILESAREEGAEAIITACHLCQSNLDTFQANGGNAFQIPVFFFSELTALSLGSAKVRRWLDRHFVSPAKLLDKFSLL